MKRTVVTMGLTALLLVQSNCTPADVDMPEPSEGAALFNQNCSVCHGANADPSAGELSVGAPDLRQITTRNRGAFPRAAVLSQIDGYGRGRVGAEQMPEFGALLEGDLVPVEVDGIFTPTPRPLAALLAYLEDIQR
ncbi:MAG: cytochrome C [Roseobacter sp. MedPE-SWde]|uniref:c-type cytochrome n=1 Tax=Roseobacter sp. MED193 TaxID=314262 RepID=UPI000068ED6A|nr:c-type cytochrome [Roseobacter sp. MED193]EAQ45966.1 cytochrome c family protein [Roseobacter sp. MED193]OIQ42848.1 MAG: cytochrome C [Roseobacter sp. MedPE-SWde]